MFINSIFKDIKPMSFCNSGIPPVMSIDKQKKTEPDIIIETGFGGTNQITTQWIKKQKRQSYLDQF